MCSWCVINSWSFVIVLIHLFKNIHVDERVFVVLSWAPDLGLYFQNIHGNSSHIKSLSLSKIQRQWVKYNKLIATHFILYKFNNNKIIVKQKITFWCDCDVPIKYFPIIHFWNGWNLKLNLITFLRFRWFHSNIICVIKTTRNLKIILFFYFEKIFFSFILAHQLLIFCNSIYSLVQRQICK